MKIVLFFLLSLYILADVVKPFEIRFKTEDNAHVELIGNTLMSAKNIKNNLNNDYAKMIFVDTDKDKETTNSSSAILNLREGSEVLYARLYWSARAKKAELSQKRMIKLAHGDSGYKVLISEEVYDLKKEGLYTASVDVTEFVQERGNGKYTVADIVADAIADHFAGWSIVIAYKHESFPFRSIALFDGYAMVTKTVDIPISGFESPSKGKFNSYLGLVAFEGDRISRGDYMMLDGKKISDPFSQEDNFFNSTISSLGKEIKDRKPNFINTLGVDVKLIDISGQIPNKATSATFTFGTKKEWYQPIVLAFVNDYNTDLSFASEIDKIEPLLPGETLTLKYKFHNKGGTVLNNLKIEGNIPKGFTYKPGSLKLGEKRLDASIVDTISFELPEPINPDEELVVEMQFRLTRKNPPYGTKEKISSKLSYLLKTGKVGSVLSTKNVSIASKEIAIEEIKEVLEEKVIAKPEPVIEDKEIVAMVEEEIKANDAVVEVVPQPIPEVPQPPITKEKQYYIQGDVIGLSLNLFGHSNTADSVVTSEPSIFGYSLGVSGGYFIIPEVAVTLEYDLTLQSDMMLHSIAVGGDYYFPPIEELKGIKLFAGGALGYKFLNWTINPITGGSGATLSSSPSFKIEGGGLYKLTDELELSAKYIMSFHGIQTELSKLLATDTVTHFMNNQLLLGVRYGF